jgi:hypothetical protein
MTMRSILRSGAVVSLIAASLVCPLHARADDELKNIRVFPKDITKRELEGNMRVWARSLGIRCTFCHEMKVPGDFRSIDFASDAIDKKVTARRMFEMVQQLNAGPLPKAVGEQGVTVSCITCHRGLVNPATLDQVVLHEVKKNGAAAGIRKYRDLREKYYGRGAYDFGPDSLDPAIQSLASEPDGIDSALALVELDIEMYPEDSETRVTQAQILLMKGDALGAAQAVDEALRLDPENRHALRLKQQLGD